MIKQIEDVLGLADTQEMYELGVLDEYIQLMHKTNGGSRKLKDSTIKLRLMILDAFAQIGWESIGVRGIYYRVVSIHSLPKTEATYKKVQAEVLAMRRDGTLGYKYVVDGSRHTYGVDTYTGVSEFMGAMAKAYRLDVWADSDFAVEVTVEKDAMRDILYPICNEYGLNLSPTSGFNSETAWYSLAERFKRLEALGKVPVLLMMTDYDTAGLTMVSSAKKAFDRFGLTSIIRHVGLLEKHINKYNLTTRIDKEDNEMRACELDAMTPDEAREVLGDAIKVFANEGLFQTVREQEERERMTILDMARR